MGKQRTTFVTCRYDLFDWNDMVSTLEPICVDRQFCPRLAFTIMDRHNFIVKSKDRDAPLAILQ
jgi:hypothetical protein